MRVQDWMTKDPITVRPHHSVLEVWRLMQDERIRHLPVVEAGKLVGIVTDRDLRLVLPSPATSLEAYELSYLLDKLTVAEVMAKDVISAPPSALLDDAARVLMRERVGALPVTEGGAVVGILTRQDVMRAFVSQAEVHASRRAA